MKRREFVGLVGVGSVIPLAITSCNSQVKETSPLSSPRSDRFQTIGTVSDLDTRRQLLAENTSVGKVLVIPDPADSNQIIAINPTCTHAGCTVAWQQDQNAFACPCHDSKFTAAGKVLQGPADQPLPTYVAKVEGNSVLVKVS